MLHSLASASVRSAALPSVLSFSAKVLSKTDSAKIVETNNKINVDSLFNSYTLAEKDMTLGSAADRTEALASEWSYDILKIKRGTTQESTKNNQWTYDPQ